MPPLPGRLGHPSPFPLLSGDFPHSQDRFQVESLRGHGHLSPHFTPQPPPRPPPLPLKLLSAQRENAPQLPKLSLKPSPAPPAAPGAHAGIFPAFLEAKDGMLCRRVVSEAPPKQTVAGRPKQITGHLTSTERNAQRI